MTNSSTTFLFLMLVFVFVVIRSPVRHLRRRGAVSPDTAIPLTDLPERDRARISRLVAQGYVREAAPRMFYYDQAAYSQVVRKRVPYLVALVVIMFIVAMVLARKLK